MSEFFERIKARLLLVLALAAGLPLPAGAAIGGALEVTQWMNGLTLLDQLSESRATVASLVRQYATQLEQYEEQIRAGRALDGQVSGLTLEGVVKELNALRQYNAAFNGLHGGVDKLKQAFDARLLEARIKSQSLADYAAAEERAIASGNARAKARLDTEMRMMQSIDEDYQLARRWGEQISGTDGVHQAMGLMNTQMNRVVQQNARMIQLMAEAQGSDKALKEAEEATSQQQQKKLLKDLNTARKANQDAMLERVRTLTLDNLPR